MKKTEIVRVRVDSRTHTALVRHCRNTGQSLSTVLRNSLEESVRYSAGAGERTLPEPFAGDELEERRAGDIATMLIAHRLSLTGHWHGGIPSNHREVSRLIGELLHAICDCGNMRSTFMPSDTKDGPEYPGAIIAS